ncbi:DUF362 domain-containing protein [Occallatibacter riparius]|uniref:DUF362 domain-containing protein n=1 Tax=Occallatibacter riparius TaxID=1002689 RepID=A0A9J7BRQ8_9BACT|nr:DUF362 domain-containing protein [Occallatibacter riparius]UWZ83606.1 DUF362 domain-containing protein [Occallatibacter riparius]
MSDESRRDFLKTCALIGAAMQLGEFASPDAIAATAGPALSIAHYRSSPQDAAAIAEEARRLTIEAVNGLGGLGRFIGKGDVVWIKPNIGWNRSPEQAATTNPDVVATLVSLSWQAGAKRVIVSDNSCNPSVPSFARSGIQQAAQKVGADCFIMDDRKFRKTSLKGKAIPAWELYGDVLEINKFINVPIVKHHGLCKATLGMKNLMGVAGGQRNRFHQDLNNTLVDLAAFIRPTLVVMDAIRVLTANGPVGGNLADVKRKDTVAAGTDQVAIDAFGAGLLGYKPQEIGYIVEGNARGLGTIDFESLKPRRIEV